MEDKDRGKGDEAAADCLEYRDFRVRALVFAQRGSSTLAMPRKKRPCILCICTGIVCVRLSEMEKKKN